MSDEIRPVSPDFIAAMEEKLAVGRCRYTGWDQHWMDCSFHTHPMGPQGQFVNRLQGEVIELVLALKEDDPVKIRKEAADVANFAMFIADIHGALNES